MKKGESGPLVSVIVPVYNGSASINRLLDALEAQRYPVGLREFIIADDASTDDTLQKVETHAGHFQIVRCTPNKGSYVARNAALRQARGDILAFTDADCIPDPDWLSQGVSAMQRQGSGLVAGAVTITPRDVGSAVQYYDAAFGIQQAHFAKNLKFGATANLFVHRDSMARLGRFDETLRSGGDRKLCERGAAMGMPLRYCPQSNVHHLPRLSFWELAVKQVRISIGHAKIFPRWSRLHILPLRHRSTESLDRKALASRDLFFRLRFRTVYYTLEFIHLWAYFLATLRLI